MTTQQTQKPQLMTPLWLISLFLSLTEVITGIAVTQATGGVQLALTTFVIAFPVLVAAAFFAILWFRPYVLYPPGEFAGSVAVGDYVRAMTTKVEVVRADVQAEAANLRANIGLETEAFTKRIEALEIGVRGLLETQVNAAQLLQRFDAERQKQVEVAERGRTEFEVNSRYRVLVVAASEAPPVGEPQMRDLAADLAKLGFKTNEAWWKSMFLLPWWELSGKPDALFIIYREEVPGVRSQLERAMRLLRPQLQVTVMTQTELALASNRDAEDFATTFDAIVAYGARADAG